MAFSQPWDETFPPDTQAANLLGDDIRDFKTAIRERVSAFAAGTLGARPTPEAVWVGVMYFATDTQQVFRWNGASWDDITSSIFPTGILADYKNTTAVNVVNPAGTQDGISIAIPANAIQVGSVLEIFAACSMSTPNNAPVRLLINGVSFNSTVIASLGAVAVLKALAIVTGASAGVIMGENQITGGTPETNVQTGFGLPFAGFTVKTQSIGAFTGTLVHQFILVRIRK